MLAWGSPGAFWLALAIIPLVILYFLRQRFRRQPVSSTYLWARLQQAVRGGARVHWWPLLLLILQIAAAMAAIAAVSRPIWISRRAADPGLAVLIDVSASMDAREQGRSRLARALSLAAAEIKKLPAGAPVAIFACGPDAELVAGPTEDRMALQARLRRIKVTAGGFREARVAESLQAWLAAREQIWRACLISDGGPDLGGQRLAEVFNGAMRWLPVGSTGLNAGLTALRLHAAEGEARCDFSAYNGWPVKRTFKVRLERDERILGETEMAWGPGWTRQSLPLRGETEPGAYSVRLISHRDSLTADDRTRLAVNTPRPITVLIVGAENPFLLAAFDRPGIDLRVAPNFSVVPRDFAADLVVADRVAIPAGLRANLLSFGTIPLDAPIYLGGDLSGPLDTADATHPLLRYVDWAGVQVGSGRALVAGPGVETLASMAGNPLCVVWGEHGAYRIVWGTDLFGSDLGLSGSYPVFLRNLLQWIVPQAENKLAYTLTVGEAALLAEPLSWRARGAVAVERRGGLVAVRALTPGLFSFSRDGERGVLAANTAPEESEITPRQLTLGRTNGQLTATLVSRRSELMQWPLAALVVLLCGEWLLWRGGWTLRRRR